jgi:DivIVA domain-containing protein
VEEAERYAEESQESAILPASAAGGSNMRDEWMTVAPAEIVGKTFSVVRRGYDQAEVDEFLRAIAGDYETAVAKFELAAGETLDPERIGKEVKDILLAAHNAAERMKIKAREDAEELVRAATTNKQRADKEIERITRAADERLVAAKTEAERIESEAQQRASRETSKEIEQAKKYARELRESAERQANDLAAKVKHREDVQQQLVGEMLSRIGKIDGLMQKLRAQFEMPDGIAFRDPETSDERESARDLKGP